MPFGRSGSNTYPSKVPPSWAVILSVRSATRSASEPGDRRNFESVQLCGDGAAGWSKKTSI